MSVWEEEGKTQPDENAFAVDVNVVDGFFVAEAHGDGEG
jgi:hypothetical protein